MGLKSRNRETSCQGEVSVLHHAVAYSVSLVCRSDGKANSSTITAASDPDLFFGFRGAGGMLGVVTAYTTVTFPVPPVVSAPNLGDCDASQSMCLASLWPQHQFDMNAWHHWQKTELQNE